MTQNMVDGLGVAGVEGVFTQVCLLSRFEEGSGPSVAPRPALRAGHRRAAVLQSGAAAGRLVKRAGHRPAMTHLTPARATDKPKHTTGVRHHAGDAAGAQEQPHDRPRHVRPRPPGAAGTRPRTRPRAGLSCRHKHGVTRRGNNHPARRLWPRGAPRTGGVDVDEGLADGQRRGRRRRRGGPAAREGHHGQDQVRPGSGARRSGVCFSSRAPAAPSSLSAVERRAVPPLLPAAPLRRSRLEGVVVGVGAAPSLPLSTAGQARRLIEEAVSLENLSKMYIWWMPVRRRRFSRCPRAIFVGWVGELSPLSSAPTFTRGPAQPRPQWW